MIWLQDNGVLISQTQQQDLCTATNLLTQLPADVNGIAVELGEIEVVVFVTETTQLIPSGSGTYPTITGLDNANDVNLRSVADVAATCATVVTPVINIQNTGQNEVTSVDITYDVNGGSSQTYTWNG